MNSWFLNILYKAAEPGIRCGNKNSCGNENRKSRKNILSHLWEKNQQAYFFFSYENEEDGSVNAN